MRPGHARARGREINGKTVGRHNWTFAGSDEGALGGIIGHAGCLIFWAQPRLTAHFGVRILPTRHIDQVHCEAVRPSAPATLTEILARTAYFEHRRSNAKNLWWRTLAQPAGVITTSQIHSSYLARARISEFESYMPSHAVGRRIDVARADGVACDALLGSQDLP